MSSERCFGGLLEDNNGELSLKELMMSENPELPEIPEKPKRRADEKDSGR